MGRRRSPKCTRLPAILCSRTLLLWQLTQVYASTVIVQFRSGAFFVSRFPQWIKVLMAILVTVRNICRVPVYARHTHTKPGLQTAEAAMLPVYATSMQNVYCR